MVTVMVARTFQVSLAFKGLLARPGRKACQARR
jgi:hypothetical protein